MEFRINKNSEIPIYQQLKEQIKYFLLNGKLKPGDRLPAPKDVAIFLHINRNTVIASYKELEKEGLIVVKHGQGTYVSENLPSIPDDGRKQALINLAQETLCRTRELGFTPHDLYTIIFGQAVLGLGQSRRTRVLFVECSELDLDFYKRELEKELKDIAVEGCLLDDLPHKMEEEWVVSADFVITTFYHVEDVKAILEPLGKEVMAIMAAPQLDTLIRIGQLAAGTRVGLICCTAQRALRMRKALEAAGIQHIVLEHAGLDDKDVVLEMVSKVDLIVTSLTHFEQVKAVTPADIPIMEFTSVLDQAGIEMLRRFIAAKH